MPITLGNIAFQALALGLLGAYCWAVYTFRQELRQCLRMTATLSHGANLRPEVAGRYDTFLSVAIALGALSAGVAAVKITALLLAHGTGTPGTIQWRLAGMAGTAGLAGVPMWVAPAAAVAVAAVTVGVLMAGVGVLKASGRLTLSEDFTDEIARTKKNWMAAASMLTLPLVAMWTGINPERDGAIAYLFGVVTVTLTVLFVVQTLRGFIRQKVSLLVWFLYLCTVEIFPLCAVIVVVARNV
jgi:hypothetical protein